ncbi:MAG: hypothetical protein ACOC22_03675 [bacterium]
MEKKIYLAVLNITSYAGQCVDASHVYGRLILSERPDVNTDNISEYNVRYLGEGIEIKQKLTLELAEKLDKLDGGKSYQRAFRIISENPDSLEEMEYYGSTERFDTFDEVVAAGIAKWKELDIACPFISLYDGNKYYANQYEPSSTVILQYNETK